MTCRIFDELAEKRAEEKRLDTLTDNVRNLMNNLTLSFTQAIQALNVSEQDRDIIMKRI